MILALVLLGLCTIFVMALGIGYISYLEYKRVKHREEVRKIYLDLSRGRRYIKNMDGDLQRSVA